MDAAPGSAAGGAAPAALAADASLAAEAAGAGERSPIGGAAAAGEGPPAEAAAGTSACDARGANGASGSPARQRSGPGTAGLARQLAEVLRRLADHEALLRRLLEQGAGAQASEALALQGVDRKVERLLRQVGRPGEPDAAPDAAARPRPGAAAPRRPREGIRELAVWSSCASSVRRKGERTRRASPSRRAPRGRRAPAAVRARAPPRSPRLVADAWTMGTRAAAPLTVSFPPRRVWTGLGGQGLLERSFAVQRSTACARS
ncbi:unnamed protein product [Prorocentrum cordatum]|uniref:Uncharacterized protein n=1 Tax=Prorocentrum cordatum TaxID=2364126 RepID=A0ABN9YD97_9DINO|nr:unnamed protein product [Polarella glacialis]